MKLYKLNMLSKKELCIIIKRYERLISTIRKLVNYSSIPNFENNKGWMKINKNTEVITQIQKMLEYDKLS